MIAASHGVAGLWTSQVALLLAVCLPAVAAGLAVGTSTVRRTDPAVFERALFVAIALLGALLALKAECTPTTSRAPRLSAGKLLQPEPATRWWRGPEGCGRVSLQVAPVP